MLHGERRNRDREIERQRMEKERERSRYQKLYALKIETQNIKHQSRWRRARVFELTKLTTEPKCCVSMFRKLGIFFGETVERNSGGFRKQQSKIFVCCEKSTAK